MSKVRVLLVDDHAVVRQGLRRILETDADIEVVGEASDGRTATAMAERLHPHVVVMDIALPELNGIEATRQIMKRNEGTKVLILTMHADEVSLRQSLKAGARGYLLKDAEEVDLSIGREARRLEQPSTASSGARDVAGLVQPLTNPRARQGSGRATDLPAWCAVYCQVGGAPSGGPIGGDRQRLSVLPCPRFTAQ